MALVRTQKDIFTYVTDNDLYQLIHTKTKNQQVSRRQRGLVLRHLKIHISLNYSAYKTHRKNLIRLLDKACKKKLIPHFKYINEKLFEKKCRLIDELTELVPHLKAYAESGNDRDYVVGECNYDYLLRLYLRYKNNDTVTLPTRSDVPSVIKEIEESMLTTLRFLMSDQITIYIANETNQDNLAKLCWHIHAYLDSQKANAGILTPNAVMISKYVNLRQDYLTGDDQRIDAILNDESDPEVNKRCKHAKIEIRASKLFHLLQQTFTAKKEFSHTPSPLMSKSIFSNNPFNPIEPSRLEQTRRRTGGLTASR